MRAFKSRLNWPLTKGGQAGALAAEVREGEGALDRRLHDVAPFPQAASPLDDARGAAAEWRDGGRKAAKEGEDREGRRGKAKQISTHVLLACCFGGGKVGGDGCETKKKKSKERERGEKEGSEVGMLVEWVCDDRSKGMTLPFVGSAAAAGGERRGVVRAARTAPSGTEGLLG